MYSTDYWYWHVMHDLGSEHAIYSALREEAPNMISVVFERACEFQCRHCIYPTHNSSEHLSIENGLEGALMELVPQLRAEEHGLESGPPRLLHVGRMLRTWHISALAKLQHLRRDLQIGLIDSGTYEHYLPIFQKAGFQLDWLDISVDGTETVHNIQRSSRNAYKIMMRGLRAARSVVKDPTEGGRVAALFALTQYNYGCIHDTADMLFSNEYVDTFGITPLLPVRPTHERIEVGYAEMEEAWRQISDVAHSVNSPESNRFFFTVYRIEDLIKCANVVGRDAFAGALQKVLVNKDEVQITLDGVTIKYVPLSMWPKEELLIDADARVRLAYSAQYRLNDSRLHAYTVAEARSSSNLTTMYQHVVDAWWSRFGKSALAKERKALRSFM